MILPHVYEMVTGKFYRVMACPQLITYKNISSVFLVDIVYSRKKGNAPNKQYRCIAFLVCISSSFSLPHNNFVAATGHRHSLNLGSIPCRSPSGRRW